MFVSAVEFCRIYIEILEQIDHCILPEYYPAIRNLYKTDPHDLVTPQTCFVSRDHAFGFIYGLLIREYQRLQKRESNVTV
jgi:hypothetical protein